MADQICADEFDLLFFTSSGGSMAMMQPFQHYINHYSPVPTDSMLSADLVLTGCNRITSRSVAFLTSKSGDTPDTLKAATTFVCMLPIMCVYPFVQKYFEKGVMIGALKG